MVFCVFGDFVVVVVVVVFVLLRSAGLWLVDVQSACSYRRSGSHD